MLICLAFCAKDRHLALRLAGWIAELGGVTSHDCLLGYHADTTADGFAEILEPHFRHVGGFKIVEDATTYPENANMMWKACGNMVADSPDFSTPWFFMEPDAVPLAPDWLDRIEAEYRSAGKPFMLDAVVTPTSRHNSGIGVYPARVRDYTQKLWQLAGIPWDVFFKDDFTPHTHHTGLIHDKFYRVWDDPNSGEPTFPDAESLSIIEPDAVLFHRNKDGTLIDRLREQRQLSREGNGAAASAPAKSGDGVSFCPPLTPPCPSVVPQDEREALLSTIAELKSQISSLTRLPSAAKINSVVKTAAKIHHWTKPKRKQKPQRAPEEQAKIDARMAKVRAGRKPQLTGVA